jgi:hypothetical protein
MRTFFGSSKITEIQKGAYSWLNEYTFNHGVMGGRIVAFPVVFFEAVLDVVKLPVVRSVECLAMTIINLIGMVFSYRYTFKDAVVCLNIGLNDLATLPVALIMFPINLITGIYLAVNDPLQAHGLFSTANHYMAMKNGDIKQIDPPAHHDTVARHWGLHKKDRGASTNYPGYKVFCVRPKDYQRP